MDSHKDLTVYQGLGTTLYKSPATLLPPFLSMVKKWRRKIMITYKPASPSVFTVHVHTCVKVLFILLASFDISVSVGGI